MAKRVKKTPKLVNHGEAKGAFQECEIEWCVLDFPSLPNVDPEKLKLTTRPFQTGGAEWVIEIRFTEAGPGAYLFKAPARGRVDPTGALLRVYERCEDGTARTLIKTAKLDLPWEGPPNPGLETSALLFPKGDMGEHVWEDGSLHLVCTVSWISWHRSQVPVLLDQFGRANGGVRGGGELPLNDVIKLCRVAAGLDSPILKDEMSEFLQGPGIAVVSSPEWAEFAADEPRVAAELLRK